MVKNTQVSKGPPSQVEVSAPDGNDDKSTASSTLPGSIPPGKKYDPVTNKVCTTIFREDDDDDNWEDFTFTTGLDGLPRGWLLLDN